MFMLMLNADRLVVAKTVRWRPGALTRTGTAPLRTRDGWATIMGPVARSMGANHFAFRQGGTWWRYSAYEAGEPVPMPSQEAVEMWLMYRA